MTFCLLRYHLWRLCLSSSFQPGLLVEVYLSHWGLPRRVGTMNQTFFLKLLAVFCDVHSCCWRFTTIPRLWCACLEAHRILWLLPFVLLSALHLPVRYRRSHPRPRPPITGGLQLLVLLASASVANRPLTASIKSLRQIDLHIYI